MTTSPPGPVVLDPDIDRFAAALLAAAPAPGDVAPPTIAEQRRRASQLRRPWAAGGPVMRRRLDRVADTAAGPVAIRIHDPGAAERPPVLVYLHGGGWTLLDLDTHDRVMRELAARSGWAVVGVDYPLAPESPFPAAIEHSAAAIDWMRREAVSLGLDPGRLAIAGDSAGANLALAVALKLRDEGRPPPAALILAYGVYDCDFTRPSYRRFGGGDYPLSAERMAFLWSNYVADPAARGSPLATPLNADLAGLPPTRLIIAEADVLYDENVALAARLRAAGNAAQAVVYLGTTHAFLEALEIADVSRRAIADAAAWLVSLPASSRGPAD